VPSLSFPSPLGWLTLKAESEDINTLGWSADRPDDPVYETPLLIEARDQLIAYFSGTLQRFDLPMSCPSTPFQHGVFEAMMSISYGHTKTYGEIAGYAEGSAQAVGRACGANPLPILIPCHRVVGARSLGGYSAFGGSAAKVFLLRLEGGAGLLL